MTSLEQAAQLPVYLAKQEAKLQSALTDLRLAQEAQVRVEQTLTDAIRMLRETAKESLNEITS